MLLKTTGGTIALVVVTLTVLWLGKSLPKLTSMLGHEALIFGAYLLVAMGWVSTLSIVSQSSVFMALGGWRPSWLLWGLLLGLALFVVSGVGYAVSAGLGFKPPAEAALASGHQGLTVLILIALVITLAVLEEWLFRGVILDFLRPQSVVLAVIGSATLFALYHLSWFQFLPAFLLGIGLALIVVRFGSVWPAVVAHALFNTIGVLIAISGRYTGATA